MVHAIDIAYKDLNSEDERIRKYHYLEDIQAEGVDYVIMMDSLEYMEDDVKYARKVSRRIKRESFFLYAASLSKAVFRL